MYVYICIHVKYVYKYMTGKKTSCKAGNVQSSRRHQLKLPDLQPSHGFPRDGEATFQGRPFLDVVPLKVVFIQAIHCCNFFRASKHFC